MIERDKTYKPGNPIRLNREPVAWYWGFPIFDKTDLPIMSGMSREDHLRYLGVLFDRHFREDKKSGDLHAKLDRIIDLLEKKASI